jgi:hypothetical protein
MSNFKQENTERQEQLVESGGLSAALMQKVAKNTGILPKLLPTSDEYMQSLCHS